MRGDKLHATDAAMRWRINLTSRASRMRGDQLMSTIRGVTRLRPRDR